jgi:23S rRNA pseudouridine2457 synthase
MEFVMSENHSYYLFYKPYNVLNQFSKEHPEHITLADYLKVEKDVYPVGRLDKDSEGLLILTNDPFLNAALLHPSKGHKRIYAAQVDGDITDVALRKVSQGVDIKLDNGMYRTRPCEIKRLSKEPQLPERNPPIRYRAAIPTSWVLLTLNEGKNRQVRKMLATVGFPVLRLVRLQIEDVKIGKLMPGESRKVSMEELFSLLHIEAGKTKGQGKASIKSGGRQRIERKDMAVEVPKRIQREGNKEGFSAWRHKGKQKKNNYRGGA